MSLRDGAKKMSKSDASDYSRINMLTTQMRWPENPQGKDDRPPCREKRR